MRLDLSATWQEFPDRVVSIIREHFNYGAFLVYHPRGVTHASNCNLLSNVPLGDQEPLNYSLWGVMLKWVMHAAPFPHPVYIQLGHAMKE